MIKLHIVLITCFMTGFGLNGCGEVDSHAPFTSVDPEFQPYLNQYSDIKKQSIGYNARFIPVQFGIVSQSGHIGECHVNGKSRWMVIDYLFWSIASENSKKELIYHEMLHCDADFYDHINISGNIMNPRHQILSNPDMALKDFFYRFY